MLLDLLKKKQAAIGSEKNLETNNEKVQRNLRAAEKKKRKLRSTQNSMYFDTMTISGLCKLIEANTFSSCLRFSDINYNDSIDEDKLTILEEYQGVLNALANENLFQLILRNKYIDEQDFAETAFIKDNDDEFNHLRHEFNNIMAKNIKEGNNKFITEKYVVYNVQDDNLDSVRKNIDQIDEEIIRRFRSIGSKATKLNGKERLDLISSIISPKEKFNFEWEFASGQRGADDVKDIIAPRYIEQKKDYLVIDDSFYRLMYISDYSSSLSDSLIRKILAIEAPITIAISLKAVPRGDDLAMVQNRIMNISGEISDIQRNAIRQNFDPDLAIPMKLSDSKNDAQEWYDAIRNDKQRMFIAQVIIMINADNLDDLETTTKKIEAINKNLGTVVKPLSYQQLDGFNACLPIGYFIKEHRRHLDTACCAILMPFSAQEMFEKGGLWYGINKTSKNTIITDRRLLNNPSGWFLAPPGAGKSFLAKKEILQVFLKYPNDEIVIIDPKNEYGKIGALMKANVLHIHNRSNIHINPLKVDVNIPGFVAQKAEFCQAFVAQIHTRSLESNEKSLIDRCVREMYSDFITGGAREDEMPTLYTFWEKLKSQPENEASKLALGIEMYVNGSYDIFAGQDNVKSDSNVTVFDIEQTEETIKEISLLVILEAIWNKVRENFYQKRRTWIYFDEIHILLKYEFSAKFLDEKWKLFRSYGAVPTGILQNVETLAANEISSTMFSNSEFIVMLKQSQSDRLMLADLLSVSPEQLSSLISAERGHGIIYAGNRALIPFEDEFPKDSMLYPYMTSDFNEYQQGLDVDLTNYFD